jgi:hypothetical protein
MESTSRRRLRAVTASLHGSAGPTPAPSLPAEQRQPLERDLRELGDALEELRLQLGSSSEAIADAEIFHKGLSWALRYADGDGSCSPEDVVLLAAAAPRGLERAAALAAGERPWEGAFGKLALGYVSAVDGSTQPYGLIVPHGHDAGRPARLDVVLHGSQKTLGLSELRHVAKFDAGDGGAAPCSTPQLFASIEPSASAAQPFLELHPLGRVENCYRYCGEADVLESIEDVCKRYSVDRSRVVLRGMSMGASGTWHIGLTRPDLFAAIGPYCGYVDTHEFSHTPAMTDSFVKVDVPALPAHQQQALRMLDSVGYAANAGAVPAIAAVGEEDGFFGVHVLMAERMRREGLQLTNLVSPGTGHVVDPVTFAEQMRHIGAYCAAGLDRRPRRLRFVTWTLKYSRCHWLQLLGLERHYERTEVFALLGCLDIGSFSRV